MCQFLSAIVTRTGEIFHHPLTDSHSDLIAYYKLKEGMAGENFARLEFLPAAGKIDQPDAYTLTVDETRIPSWLDDDAKASAENRLRELVRRMIVTDLREICMGEKIIVGNGGYVVKASDCRIIAVTDGGTVKAIWGGTVEAIRGGTVEAIRGGTVKEIRGGTVKAIRGGTVKEIWGGNLPSTVGVYATMPKGWKPAKA